MYSLYKEFSFEESYLRYSYDIVKKFVPIVIVNIIFGYMENHIEDIKWVRNMEVPFNIYNIWPPSTKKFCSKIYVDDNDLYVNRFIEYDFSNKYEYEIMVFDRQTYKFKKRIKNRNNFPNMMKIIWKFSQIGNLVFDTGVYCVAIYKNDKQINRWNFKTNTYKEDVCATEKEVFVASFKSIEVYTHNGTFLYDWQININGQIRSIAIKEDDVFVACILKNPILLIFNKQGILQKQYRLNVENSSNIKIMILNDNLFVILDKEIIVFGLVYFRYNKN